MILSSLFFVLIMLILLYWALIPMYCNNLTDCRLDSEKSAIAYHWFVGVLVVLMVASNVLTAATCPSVNKGMNIFYAIFSTLACWAIFVFVVYTREYLRMSFANVFGYLWVSKKANDLLNNICPKKYVDLAELVENLHERDKSGIKYKETPVIDESLLISANKIRIDDNFELLTYLRSGANYIPSLTYVKDYTNKKFNDTAKEAIEKGEDGVKANADLIALLDTLYIRDVIGEVVLFVLVGVMCSYLSEYLIKKINCGYRTRAEIDQAITEYDEQYEKQKEMDKKQIVVTM